METQINNIQPTNIMPTITQERVTHKKTIFDLFKEAQHKPYFEEKKHNVALFKADCLDVLSELPENSIDMIFADPPYFLSNGGFTCHAGKMVSVNKGHWDKSMGVEANHIFNRKWLSACKKALTQNGTIWVSGTAHVIHSIGYAMQQLGFKLLNDIVWFKINPPPNLSCRYFTHSTETIIWAAKSLNTRHMFNYSTMKSINGKQMKNTWQDLFWAITPPKSEEKIYGKHPTQKPIELLERIILASTKPGDIILDPFSGSGTTGIAAYRNRRQYIGIDLEEGYLETSKKRFKDAFNVK